MVWLGGAWVLLLHYCALPTWSSWQLKASHNSGRLLPSRDVFTLIKFIGQNRGLRRGLVACSSFFRLAAIAHNRLTRVRRSPDD